MKLKRSTGRLRYLFAGIAIGLAVMVFHNRHQPQSAPIIVSQVEAKTILPSPAPSPPPTVNPDPTPEDFAATYHVATEAVRSDLQAAQTVKFSNWGLDAEATISPYGYNQWVASGVVYSQNPSGVPRPDYWSVVLIKAPKGWDPVYLVIGDTTLGIMPEPAPFPRQLLTPAQIAEAKTKLTESRKKGAEAALKYNQDLAAKGDAYGELRMGERYRDGDGVEKNLTRAHELLSQSAAQGNAAAADALVHLPAR